MDLFRSLTSYEDWVAERRKFSLLMNCYIGLYWLHVEELRHATSLEF